MMKGRVTSLLMFPKEVSKTRKHNWWVKYKLLRDILSPPGSFLVITDWRAEFNVSEGLANSPLIYTFLIWLITVIFGGSKQEVVFVIGINDLFLHEKFNIFTSYKNVFWLIWPTAWKTCYCDSKLIFLIMLACLRRPSVIVFHHIVPRILMKLAIYEAWKRNGSIFS